MYYYDEIASDGESIANLFAQHSPSVYNDPVDNDLVNLLDYSRLSININRLYMGITEVLEKLNNIDTKKGPGLDEISAYFLFKKLCLDQCIFCLTNPCLRGYSQIFGKNLM